MLGTIGYSLLTLPGLQGALLSRFLAPIYLSSITIGDYPCKESLERAIWTRIKDVKVPKPFECQKLEIYTTTIPFLRGKEQMLQTTQGKTGTSSNGNDSGNQLIVTAINWHAAAEVEVTSTFGGKKMGTTSKNFSQPSQRYLLNAFHFLSFSLGLVFAGVAFMKILKQFYKGFKSLKRQVW